MKRWMTLAEIAAEALPGLPGSARGMAKRAQTEGWTRRVGMSRPRRAIGGGLEFSIELLPVEARTELARRAGDGLALPADAVVGPELREDDPLTGAARERRDARLHVLAMFEAFRRAKDLAVRDAIVTFSVGWCSGEISAPDWVLKIVPTISKNTLLNWRAIHRDHGPDALGIDRRGRPALIDSVADGKAKEVALAAIAKQEFLTAEDLTDFLRDRLDGQFPADFSVRTMRRTRARLEAEHRNVLMKLRDPDGYRSRIEVSATASTFAAGLNDLWQIDASPADVMLRGKKRHSIYMAVDIWSRRLMVLVTQSARAEAVAALVRRCLLAWGVPKRIQTDQGSDFTAKATARLMTALGIEHEISDAFDPAAKGNVERAIKTFQHSLQLCPGFIGHNVADRKKIEGRKAFSRRLGMDEEQLFGVELDLPEFQAWSDSWCDTIYAHKGHGGLKGQTPFLKAASWQGELRKIAHPRALDVLLAPVAGKDGIRRVTKQGIKIDGEYYMTAAAWPGDDVLVRMDPADLGRVLVFALDGETFLGEAICAPLAGMDPAEIAMRVKAAQKDHEKAGTDRIRKEMRQIGPRDFMEASLRQAQKRAASLTYLERPATPYSTPALDAALDAAKSGDPEVPAYTPEQSARASAAIIAMPPPKAPPKTTPEQRFRRAIGLEAEIEAGRPIDDDDEAWLRGYRQGAEYKGWMKVFELKGEAMFVR